MSEFDEKPLSGRLINSDIAPTVPENRTWGTWHICALWIGMSVCVTTYRLAADLVIDAGLSAVEALVVIALGNLIILVPMVLNAHPGTKYGIPFPVLARASFGIYGANIPAMMRAFVACGWFGIQTWIGGKALYQLYRMVTPEGLGIPNILPDWVGLNTEQAIAVLIFWLINVYFIVRGTESIKWLESLSAPFLIAVGIALLVWAYDRAGGLGPLFSRPSRLDTTEKWMTTFFPVLTGMVGYWSTVALNIPDFSRYARGQREQAWGQALGLPLTMVLYSFIGVAVTSVTEDLYAKPLRDPIDVVAQIGGTGVVILSMVALSVATLTTNIAANVVSPANDISNLAPHRISYKTGGLVTAVAGIAFFPWKVYESHKVYVETWLIGYAMLLAPIAAIMIVDYFIIRKREINVNDLYREQGEYTYARGFNPVAIAALVIGIAPNLPGFITRVTHIGEKLPPPTLWDHIYNLSWFVGFVVGGAAYLALTVATRAMRKPAAGATAVVVLLALASGQALANGVGTPKDVLGRAEMLLASGDEAGAAPLFKKAFAKRKPRRYPAHTAIPSAADLVGGGGASVYAIGASTLYRLDRRSGLLETVFARRGESLYRVAASKDDNRVLFTFEEPYAREPSLLVLSREPYGVRRVKRPFLPDELYFDRTEKFAVLYRTDQSERGPRGFKVHKVALDPPFAIEHVFSAERQSPLASAGDGFVYVDRSGGNTERYVLRAVEGGEKTIAEVRVATKGEERGVHVIRSPSGKKVALLDGAKDKAGSLLFVHSVDTGETLKFEVPVVGWLRCKAFSLDEDAIVLSPWTEGGELSVHRVNLKTGVNTKTEVKLARGKGAEPVVSACGVMQDGQTTWIYAGRELVFVGADGKTRVKDLVRLAKRRRPEWAGAIYHFTNPEQFYIGVEVGGFRRFVRVTEAP